MVYAPLGQADSVRVAYAIGKRTGNAVVRNRIRRRLRSALGVLDSEQVLPAGTYLVSASTDAASVPFADLVASLRMAVVAVSRGPR